MSTQYTDRVVHGMEALYGKGFLSPGGAEEMSVLLEGVALGGGYVLDLGCGLGGASLLLAATFDAGRVTGIDLDAGLVCRARAAAEAAGLADKIAVRTVEAGPLPFDGAVFDAVFAKDAVCHIADKGAIFAEVARVLAPGGQLICADFVPGEPLEDTGRLYDDWLDAMRAYGLSFHFEGLATYTAAFAAAGLGQVRVRDHSRLSEAAAGRELAFLAGPEAEPLRAALGEDRFRTRIHASRRRFEALAGGALRHLHMFAALAPAGD